MQPAHHAVHPERGGREVDVGVLDLDLRGEGDALDRLRDGLERAVLDAVHGRREQAGAGEGEPGEQIAAGVGGADVLGDDAVDRSGVEALLDEEGGRPPVTWSPAIRECCTGAAPRQAGSSEKCRLTQPRAGMSRATLGSSAP
ncbi:hypothetical protein STANM309S_04791 [Streptomyces tanashiensis]